MIRQSSHKRWQVFYSFATVALLVASSFAAYSSELAHRMSIEDFVQLQSFEGRITKLEDDIGIEYPRSISGPDFRVTVTADDGSVIVIDRMPTMSLRHGALAKIGRSEKVRTPRRHRSLLGRQFALE